VQLFDDGNHNDGTAGDSLFANSWLVLPFEERNFYIDLQITRIETDTVVNHLDNMVLFTTIGPVVFDSYEIPQQGANFFTLKLYLRNDGSTETAANVTAVLLTTDTNVINIGGISHFGNIAAGQVKSQVSFPNAIYYQNNPGSINFIVNIFSNSNFFWSDSFTVIDIIPGIAENETNLPIEYALKQNYPNPFNPTTKILYSVPEESLISIKIYNTLGEGVTVLVNENKSAGSYEVMWNGKNHHGQRVTSGIYFYIMEADNFVQVRKMVYLQ
jgi:hypothetical protein